MILKSRRRHHHRKRTTTNVNVGFLNLHGARKAAKWAELYKTLNSEKIALYGVVETHLRELEEPPVDPRMAVGGLQSYRGLPQRRRRWCAVAQQYSLDANEGSLCRAHLGFWDYSW
ncbi:hypothetical protein MRX96_059625 [Rhipicephalus microplus]